MVKDVLISIRGTQKMQGDEPQTIELMTAGTLQRKDGGFLVRYVESEVTGMEGVDTTFEVQQGRITLRRAGAVNSTMVFEVGKKNESLYDMGFGALLIGVNASRIESDLHDDGGSFAFDYAIEIENEPVGINQYDIRVRSRAQQEPASGETMN